MGWLGGTIAGFGERAHEENLISLQQHAEAKQRALDIAMKTLDSLPEERHGQALQLIQQFASDPRAKADKFTKDYMALHTTPVERQTATQTPIMPPPPPGAPVPGASLQTMGPQVNMGAAQAAGLVPQVQPPPPSGGEGPMAAPIPPPPGPPMAGAQPVTTQAMPIPAPPETIVAGTRTERMTPQAARRQEVMAQHLDQLQQEAKIRATEPLIASEEEAKRLAKMSPEEQKAYLLLKGKGISTMAVPGTVSGKALIQSGTVADPASGAAIDPDKEYRVIRNTATQQVVGTFEASPTNRMFKAMWKEDPAHPGTYLMQALGPNGKPLGEPQAGFEPPAHLRGRISQTNQWMDDDGNIHTSTTSGPAPKGAAVGGKKGAVPIPPAPGAANAKGTGSVNLSSKVEDWAHLINTGQAALSEVPSKPLRNKIVSYMTRSGLVIHPKMGAASAANAETQLAGLDTSIGLVQAVQKDITVLNSMISAGKISLASQPGIGLVITRLMPLDEKESRVAANMQSLSEHINTIRGPLGAAGFRGPEAFAALQAQRGMLMQDPKISAQVLRTTLDTMQRIRAAKEKYLPGGGGGPAGQTLMVSPQGVRGYVPDEQVADALKEGYKKP